MTGASQKLKPITEDFSPLIGVSYATFNCWQIIREFYWIVFNVHLKHYFEDSRRIEDRSDIHSLIYSNIGEFERVDGAPRFGDLILIKIHGVESHIAVYVNRGTMFHSSKKTGSVIDRVDRWKNHITGYYRLKVAA